MCVFQTVNIREMITSIGGAAGGGMAPADAAAVAPPVEEVKKPVVVEEESDSDDDMGLSLFDWGHVMGTDEEEDQRP